MTKALETVAVKAKDTKEIVGEKTKAKLKEVKGKISPSAKAGELVQKFLKDAKNMDSKERVKQIGVILATLALASIFKDEDKEKKKPKQERAPEKTKKQRAATKEKKKALAAEIGKKEEVEEVEELSPEEQLRKDILDTSRAYSGSNRFDEDFKNNELLKGGRLGCAWVVSSILKDVGALDKVYPGTYTAENALLKKGWTKAPASEAEPGDVVMWNKIGQTVKKTSDGPQYVGGHRHIGIVTGPNEAISNSSFKKGPITHKLDKKRGIEFIMKPPSGFVAKETEYLKAPKKRRSTTPKMPKAQREKYLNGDLIQGITAAFPEAKLQGGLQKLKTNTSKRNGVGGKHEITNIQTPDSYTRRGTEKVPTKIAKKIRLLSLALRSDDRMPLYTGIAMNIDGVDIMMVKEKHMHSMSKYGKEGLSDYYYKPHTGVSYIMKKA